MCDIHSPALSVLFAAAGLQTVRFSSSFSVSSDDVPPTAVLSIFAPELKSGFCNAFVVAVGARNKI